MCGIVGYVGYQNSSEILINGLRRLEYRGYDSAGVAVVQSDGEIGLRRCMGKLSNLERMVSQSPVEGHLGIGHTRWATHGKPSDENAHPHKAGKVVVVHNGIIENHLALRKALMDKGHTFKSETDTEIFSHLIQQHIYDGASLAEAVRLACLKVEGAYAIAVISASEPDRFVVAKNASPLVLGLGEGESFCASDIPALLPYTRRVVFLDEGEMAILTREGMVLQDLEGQAIAREAKVISWSPVMAEKGGYKHFMQKEIHEQPRAVTDTLRGRISLPKGEIYLDVASLANGAKAFQRVCIIGCGTSYHAGLVGKFLIEELSLLPCEVDLASEFRYRKPVVNGDVLVVVISQSGETADTLAALREAQSRGARVLGICNVVDSSIARAADDVLYTHAGPEIGVASTKAFTTQLTSLVLLAIQLGLVRDRLQKDDALRLFQSLREIPSLMQRVLDKEEIIAQIAQRYMHANNFLYLGRGINYPIALEGALKLKEISYIHAEGYPAGEMKHGPIALVDHEMPVLFIATKSEVYEKVRSNMQEVKAREGRIIAVSSDGDQLSDLADHVVTIPPVNCLLEPLLTVLPLQMLAYKIADLRGTDVDQPRNLAKSVTVE